MTKSKDTPSLLFFASHPCCFYFCLLWECCDTDDDTTVSSVDAQERYRRFLFCVVIPVILRNREKRKTKEHNKNHTYRLQAGLTSRQLQNIPVDVNRSVYRSDVLPTMYIVGCFIPFTGESTM
mmetsp:Transcript_10442/g.11875  ORF Transcript_10442/g.11875 Transcript_10442/m.11875 type:complete len:123 (-) Transcript_10442:458-826(-)